MQRIIQQHLGRAVAVAASAAAAISCLQPAHATPTVRRLTPPSELFKSGDATPPIISRFLPGQRFDLQATISPDAGKLITGAQFLVDGNMIPAAVTWSVANAAATPPLAANSVVASLRAYWITEPGVHTFAITAIQSDNQNVTATGNFEVVDVRETGLAAKRIIIMIGDGMGIAHRTAARIMSRGVSQGKANAALSMDLFPFTGVVTTHSLNSICTDSSPGASCYATGNKANNNQHGVFPDDTTENGDNPRVESIGEYLHRTHGRSLGLVTTTDVFDSTPAAFGSHTQQRASGAGICDEYFDEQT